MPPPRQSRSNLGAGRSMAPPEPPMHRGCMAVTTRPGIYTSLARPRLSSTSYELPQGRRQSDGSSCSRSATEASCRRDSGRLRIRRC
jgi:hypothetical protein